MIRTMMMLWAVSPAPLAKLQAYKRRMGWTFPRASSFGNDFNFNFAVGFTKEQQREERSSTTMSARAHGRRSGGGCDFRRDEGTDPATYLREMRA